MSNVRDDVTLDDKYTVTSGRVFLTGTQALVRLPLLQHQRDRAQGLNTGGLISGYRGSPLGNVDREIGRARSFLEAENIHFQPGVNEDLAATAIWGSQQLNMFPGAKVDGVFAMWYGKGPGVDRSGDVFKHANFSGASPHGGVLVVAGDDPACKSSTIPSQSEFAFMDAQIPVLNPSNVQDYLDLGIYGWAMSRFSGLWIGLKAVSESVESSASVYVDPARVQIKLPEDFAMPPEGLGPRWPDPPLAQELRLQRHKIYAALAFAKANQLDRIVIDSPSPRLGIVTTGKSYLDVMQALEDLGIDQKHASEIGLRVYKVGMSWPLERDGARHFAEGLEEILVIEEKRAVIENQLKEQLYNWREDVRPRVVGKFDENRQWILPSAGELTPAIIARVIAARVDRFYTSERIRQRLAFLEAKEQSLNTPQPQIQRIPYFCSGCPHNTSTRVPEGSRAVAGIGCHYMAVWMDRQTATFSHMGGEGVSWLGQAPFSEEKHIFANLGDGTYFHSGILAIRAAVSASVNITYKVLFNDAVAMTGGQPFDGPLSVPIIARQVAAEGVNRIAVVSDEPNKYPIGEAFPPGVTFHHRDALDGVQRDLRQWPGVSVLIYDQTCAAEKRRRRKRKTYFDPNRRVAIHPDVCEGCGDCGLKSNCVSLTPLETEWGRKRAVDQSSCNKDFSCVNGFCPAFVSIIGGKPRRKAADAAALNTPFPALPEPQLPELTAPYGVIITGIGGTGVVTVGAVLAMAAHLEGKGVSVLDMIGLAQKNGAVISHLRLASKPEDIQAVRIAAGAARAVIGCDMVTAGSYEALSKMNSAFTRAAINSHQTMTADFTRDRKAQFPDQELREAIANTCDGADFFDATAVASGLLGDSLATNTFMIGYAWQKGLLPLSEEAILKAITLNGVAVSFNHQAFLWGRRAAHDAAAVRAVLGPAAQHRDTADATTVDLAHMIEKRVDHLTAYGSATLGARYRALVERVRAREHSLELSGLAEAVAQGYHKLLAYKDEYEVARLYADPAFLDHLRDQFEGPFSVRYHLAPPLVTGVNPDTGEPRKQAYGPWMLLVFRLLARLKVLRGSWLDPFAHTAERRQERQLIGDYEALMDELLQRLDGKNHALAVALAALPQEMVGFGPVKARNVAAAKSREAELLAEFRSPGNVKRSLD